jgi:hypothetical protein
MTEAKIDANEFASQVEALLKEGLPLADVGAARIYKDAPNDVTFTVYNFVDTVYWIPAQRTLIGSHWHGDVAASGIHSRSIRTTTGTTSSWLNPATPTHTTVLAR